MRRILFALALAAFASPALADAEPDVSIAGRWRVVAAERAPWASGQNLPTPFLRTGFVFRAGRLMGPSPIACEPADYKLVMMPAEGLFQGALPADRAVALGEKLGVVGPGETVTHQVTCPNATFDFHRATDSISLKIAIDNVVYTLRQPDGDGESLSDEAFVSAATPGFACGRARSTTERLICGNAEASRLDREMAAAFGRLRLELSAEGRTALLEAQRTFLAFRDRQCRSGGAMPREETARRDAARCLAELTGARADILKGMVVRRAGALTIEPRITTRWESRRSDDDEVRSLLMDDVLPVASGPGAAEFNRAFRIAVPTGRPLDVALYRQRMPDLTGAITRSYDVALADNRLVSLMVTGIVETGTRVAPTRRAVTYDLTSRSLAGPADIFRIDEAFRSFLAARVAAHARERNFIENAAETQRRMLDPDIWLYQADKAVLTVPWLGVDAEELEIPAEDLARFLKPGGPWRPAR
jgi:uncharacterized protein YecT (DUF1311 family)